MRKILLALALVSAACSDDSSGPDPIEIDGSWAGSFQVPSGGTGSLTMTLQESGGQVTGNGNITGPSGSLAITVSGTYSEPNAALAIASSGFNDLSLTGVVGEEQFTGTFQGSGFTGTAVTLHRQ
jgi:hypothetical protein